MVYSSQRCVLLLDYHALYLGHYILKQWFVVAICRVYGSSALSMLNPRQRHHLEAPQKLLTIDACGELEIVSMIDVLKPYYCGEREILQYK